MVKCISCNQELVEYNGYFVCNKCKALVFSKTFSNEKIKEEIEKHLEETQAAILGNIDRFHDIEQKSISGIVLTREEENIKNTLSEFQNIRLEYETLFQNIRLEYGTLCQNSEIMEKISKSLYQLLVVSEKLSSFL